MEADHTDWKSIICRGIESDELDYKAAQNWKLLTRAGRAKFVRHCIAMANTKGGYVVVGVGEDAAGQPALFTGLTKEEAHSFDPTDVGNFINRFADPAVDFTLERPVVDGKRYVVFVIRPFRALPHVCTSSCENELALGTFYIRTADASSRPAYRSSEMHALIQRTLRNQREMLGRMIRGILYEDPTFQSERQQSSRFEEEIKHTRDFFSKRRVNPPESNFRLMLTVQPPEYIAEKFSLSELQMHLQEAFVLLLDAVFIQPEEIRNAYFTNVSLRSFSGDRTRLWQLYQSGLFCFSAVFPYEKGISYLFLVHFFSEAISFLARLYGSLGYSAELLSVQLSMRNTENVPLIETPSANRNFEFICRIPEISLHLERTAADLSSAPTEHAVTLIRKVCERFNLPEGRHQNLQKQVADIAARK